MRDDPGPRSVDGEGARKCHDGKVTAAFGDAQRGRANHLLYNEGDIWFVFGTGSIGGYGGGRSDWNKKTESNACARGKSIHAVNTLFPFRYHNSPSSRGPFLCCFCECKISTGILLKTSDPIPPGICALDMMMPIRLRRRVS